MEHIKKVRGNEQLKENNRGLNLSKQAAEEQKRIENVLQDQSTSKNKRKEYPEDNATQRKENQKKSRSDMGYQSGGSDSSKRSDLNSNSPLFVSDKLESPNRSPASELTHLARVQEIMRNLGAKVLSKSSDETQKPNETVQIGSKEKVAEFRLIPPTPDISSISPMDQTVDIDLLADKDPALLHKDQKIRSLMEKDPLELPGPMYEIIDLEKNNESIKYILENSPQAIKKNWRELLKYYKKGPLKRLIQECQNLETMLDSYKQLVSECCKITLNKHLSQDLQNYHSALDIFQTDLFAYRQRLKPNLRPEDIKPYENKLNISKNMVYDASKGLVALDFIDGLE